MKLFFAQASFMFIIMLSRLSAAMISSLNSPEMSFEYYLNYSLTPLTSNTCAYKTLSSYCQTAKTQAVKCNS